MVVEAKRWYESKVFWLNVVTALVMILDLLTRQPFIPQEWIPIILFVIAVVNVILRVFFTDTGIATARIIRARQISDQARTLGR